LDGCEEVGRQLVVAGCDPPVVFEAAKHALDCVSATVENGAEAVLPTPGALRRDIGYRALVLDLLSDRIGVS
jgi:hypothetical protein